MSEPQFTVVVPTRHRAHRLSRCLDDLARLEGVAFEVIVVDNTQGDPAVARVAAEAGVRRLVEPRVGLSRARNIGAVAARGKYVAFTDDDAAPRPDWLVRHLDVLESPARPAGTTGRVLPAPVDSPPARAYLAGGGEDLGRRPFRVDRSGPDWFDRAHFGGTGLGPNMVLRLALFESGFRFRESLGPCNGIPGEEHYAFFRLIRDGHAIEYVPEALVHHDAPPTLDAVAERQRQILRGAAAYCVMLLVEEPGARRPVLRYLARGARRRRQRWREVAAEPLARTDKLRASLHGPGDYLRWRHRWGHGR